MTISAFSQYFIIGIESINVLPIWKRMFVLSFSRDRISLIFLIILLIVTAFVSLFSQTYLEYYNNKKYLITIITFFISIVFMSISSRPVSFLWGWDYLGISSVFLIIFYANKNNLNNAMWTIFFNRFGDILIIIYVILRWSDWVEIIIFDKWYSDAGGFALLFISLCALTKRAQFPFSSWLPLAMSAPTPISAIVHSSTLVTAGVLVTIKISDILLDEMRTLLLLPSIWRFIAGGALASWEADYKKIIAFSTISQIRMIIVLSLLKLTFVSIIHTLLHAFFKRFMFMNAGTLFMKNFSFQRKSKLNSFLKKKSYRFFLLISIFSMVGCPFSSSFFSKDYAIEIFISERAHPVIICTIFIGALITINYSKILASPTVLQTSPTKIISLKKFFPLTWIMMLINLTTLYLISNSTNLIPRPLARGELRTILAILIIFLFVDKFEINSKKYQLELIQINTIIKYLIKLSKDKVKTLAVTEKTFVKKAYMK